jgi:hypothetical protein
VRQMREKIEFRIPEVLAERYLPAALGQRLGIARKLEVDAHDPLVIDIKRIDQQLRMSGEGALFTSWDVHRHYSRSELINAELLHGWPKKVFEPAGEECGTMYGDNHCPECGAGASQLTPLFLDGRRVPYNVDFARTIANEIIVSASVREVFEARELSGVEFSPVKLSNKDGKLSVDHFQLRVVGPPVLLDSKTRTGGNLFDESGYGRCPRGDVVGLNLLSEVTVRREGFVNADVMVTQEMIGVRRGLLRPRPILLFSPKAWRTIEERKLKGLVIEVAYLS